MRGAPLAALSRISLLCGSTPRQWASSEPQLPPTLPTARLPETTLRFCLWRAGHSHSLSKLTAQVMTTWNPLIHTWLFRGATEKLADASKTCNSVTGVFSKSFMLERCRETLTHSCASTRCICLFIPSHINMSLASKSFTETLAKDSEWASYTKTRQSPQGWRIPHDLPLRTSDFLQISPIRSLWFMCISHTPERLWWQKGPRWDTQGFTVHFTDHCLEASPWHMASHPHPSCPESRFPSHIARFPQRQREFLFLESEDSRDWFWGGTTKVK